MWTRKLFSFFPPIQYGTCTEQKWFLFPPFFLPLSCNGPFTIFLGSVESREYSRWGVKRKEDKKGCNKSVRQCLLGSKASLWYYVYPSNKKVLSSLSHPPLGVSFFPSSTNEFCLSFSPFFSDKQCQSSPSFCTKSDISTTTSLLWQPGTPPHHSLGIYKSLICTMINYYKIVHFRYEQPPPYYPDESDLSAEVASADNDDYDATTLSSEEDDDDNDYTTISSPPPDDYSDTSPGPPTTTMSARRRRLMEKRKKHKELMNENMGGGGE